MTFLSANQIMYIFRANDKWSEVKWSEVFIYW